jgi:S-adenosylmethionine:tRNA ribosyltransferase-isomerase
VRTDQLDYDLPAELVAQAPAEPRDAARLLVYDRAARTTRHRHFRDLLDELRDNDVVVVNATRVLPVRVHARRPTGGMAEVLLVEPRGDGTWEALARPLRKLTPGTRLVASAALEIEVGERIEGGRLIVRPVAAGTLEDALRDVGEMPLPPYIRERSADPERYQTVYARTAGSAAAPTAGLHFTPELLQAVRERCTVVEVDLRIGLDTFRPVVADDLDEHEMHSEAYAVDPAVRELLRGARGAGRRVVAVGTTATRVLETIADPAAPDEGRTRLKIQPGYRFALVDALVTNFHLPRSTLLALVMAFAGEDETRRLYEEAVAERYRFYSFGDAMLIT